MSRIRRIIFRSWYWFGKKMNWLVDDPKDWRYQYKKRDIKKAFINFMKWWTDGLQGDREKWKKSLWPRFLTLMNKEIE